MVLLALLVPVVLGSASALDPNAPKIATWSEDLSVASHPQFLSQMAPTAVVEQDGVVSVATGDRIHRFRAFTGSSLASFAAPANVFLAAVAMDTAGGTFAVGTLDPTGTDPEIWVGRYNSAGTLTWSDTFGEAAGTGMGQDRGTAIVLDDNDGIYVGGTLSSGFLADPVVRKYTNGPGGPIFAWDNATPAADASSFLADLTVHGGHVYAVGLWFGPQGSAYVSRIDAATGADGNFNGTFPAADPLFRASGVAATDAGVYISGGRTAFTASGPADDAVVLKLHPTTLVVVWEKTIGTSSSASSTGSTDWANDVVVNGTSVLVGGVTTRAGLGDPLSGLSGTGGFLRQYNDNGANASTDFTLAVPPIQALGYGSAYAIGSDPAGSGACGTANRTSTGGDCFLVRVIDQVRCGGRVATIVGTSGSDTIRGTKGPDVIHGLGSNDTISGKGGRDVICGGNGRDLLRGNGGADTIFGQKGNDTIKGGSKADTIKGNGGRDTIAGGKGPDTISGGSKADIIEGNAGNDVLRGNGGNDTIRGGPGNDTCFGGSGTNKLSS